jgi:hypothetical protein
MAATITKQAIEVMGTKKRRVISFAGDASYPNPAGYPVTPGMLGFRKIEGFDVITGHNGFTPRWDPASGSVKLYRTGNINLPMEHVPNGVNVTTAVFNLAFWGV